MVTDLIKSIEYVKKRHKLDQERSDWLAELQLVVNEKTDELSRVRVLVIS